MEAMVLSCDDGVCRERAWPLYMVKSLEQAGFAPYIVERTRRLATLAGEKVTSEVVKWGDKESQMLAWMIRRIESARTEDQRRS